MDPFFFHPRVVHLPIGLAIAMPLVTVAILLAWRQRWLPPRTWALVVGLQLLLVVSGVLAIRSGEAEEERVEQVVSENLIEEHEEASKAFTWVSFGVLVLMAATLGFSRGRLGFPLALLSLVGSFVVFALAYRAGGLGGALVYRHGAAQPYVDELGSPSAGDDE